MTFNQIADCTIFADIRIISILISRDRCCFEIYTATCSATKDTYHHNPNTGRSELRAGTKGCGQRYRVEGYTPKKGGAVVLSIPREEDGKVALRFTCTCGAELRAWPQLQGYRPTE